MAKKLARVSGVEDRLSSLPDDILIHNILSLLPMKDAARMCILARRWRFMPLYLLNLDFDASDKVGRQPLQILFGPGGEATWKYVRWVDRVIGAYAGKATLHRFRVCFWLDYSPKIVSWLQFCLDKGVEVLELDASRWYSNQGCSPFKVPLLGPAQLCNLKLLKSLTLGGLNMASDALEHILPGCHSLERLQLHGLQSFTYLNVSGPISRLKSIHISWCIDLQSITVSAPTPDLVSFIYPVKVSHLYLEHAPRLVDLTIGTLGSGSSSFNILSHPLFHYIAQLDTLRLTIPNWHEVEHWLPHLPSLSRLKCLRLELNGLDAHAERLVWPQKLHGVASLIKAARCVEHLSLATVLLNGRAKITEEFAGLHLEFLRVIELRGFRGRRVEYALALHLVKGAAASASPLEKLIIDCRTLPLVGCRTSEKWDSTSEIEKRKSQAKRRFERELPPTVELVLI